ncbi:MAG TPA: pyridoxal phosphate-dependent aminotransferase [Gemmatimonadaceae bacterium]|nr:pyridoxal phosphate-dependent aminotransferase [Gemmatimonadaceae bacterium]
MTISATYVPSDNVSQLRESATIAVSQRARALKAQGRPIIDLGAGEPDFDTPPFIRRAASRALEEGATRYTAVEGILPLREVIAERANREYAGSDPVTPQDVVVTTGSKQALFNACFTLFGSEDEVLVPTPAWTSYYEMVELARANAVPVRGAPSHGFKVTAEDLLRHTTERTRGVILNSPCNPTGAVYTAAELGELVQLAEERQWWLISDEIYGRIAYDGAAAGVLSLARARDHLVIVDGMAKAWAMTGWRIGWAIAPAAVARTLTALQSHTTSNATTVAQHAALAALREWEASEREITRMVAEYRRRRDAAMELLRSRPAPAVVRPDGAFYLFIDVGATAPPGSGAGTAFATRLLEEHGVAVVPGAAFRTPDWIRLSYAAALADVVEGVRRVLALWRSLTAERGSVRPDGATGG